MTETDAPSASPRRFAAARSAVREAPGWKKIVFGAAGVALVLGLVLQGIGAAVSGPKGGSRVAANAGSGSSALQPNGGATTLVPGVQQRVPEGTSPPQNPETDAESNAFKDWSPVLVRGGLSFFIGFSVGYALRTFFKISALVAGLVFLAIFGLSYLGFLTVNWEAMSSSFDNAMARIKEEAAQFKTFVTGSLPAAGVAVVGLYTGFKRR
jgi:uncharacterized membrane protein (Fun14 family)